MKIGQRKVWYPGLVMQPDTYKIITGKECQCPSRTSQAATVPANAKSAEVPRCIQHHESQMYKWLQMVNVEDILKQELLESIDEK